MTAVSLASGTPSGWTRMTPWWTPPSRTTSAPTRASPSRRPVLVILSRLTAMTLPFTKPAMVSRALLTSASTCASGPMKRSPSHSIWPLKLPSTWPPPLICSRPDTASSRASTVALGSPARDGSRPPFVAGASSVSTLESIIELPPPLNNPLNKPLTPVAAYRVISGWERKLRLGKSDRRVGLQVRQHRFPRRLYDAVHDELGQPLLDAADLGSRGELADPHDVLAVDRRRQSRRLLGQHGVEACLQLVQLLAVWICGGADVGARQLHQPPQLRAGIPRQAAHRSVRPLRAVEHGPEVKAHE